MSEKNEEILEEVLEDLEKEAAEKTAKAETAEAETAEAENTENAEETEDSAEAETAEDTASGEGASDSAASDDTKKLLQKEKDKRDEQIEELNDKVKRQMAEFENFRKRTEKEKTQMYDMGAKNIIEKVLPVIDNFERGLAAVPEEQKEDAFVVGMDKIYKQMLTELDAAGVKPIEAVGQEFNPDFHNAVMQVESAEYESGVVAQELLKGYMYKDSVVRHSMVAVVS